MAPLGSAAELEAPRGAGLLSPPGLVASPASARASPARQGAAPLAHAGTPPPQPGPPARAALQTPPPARLEPVAPADGALTSELTCCAGAPAALSTTPKGPTASPGSRHMVVEVDAIARIVPLPGADCRAAAAPGGDAPAAERAAEGGASAGTPAGAAGFVPRYHVCVNPLCRRKWKQLTPKVLPLFCPPCKRSLEDGIPGSKDMPEAALTKSMCGRWRAICTELTQVLGGQDAAAMDATSSGDAGLRLAEGHIPASSLALWSSTLSAFAGHFPVRPDPEDVRNWNSVHSRRKHFRGVIHRCQRRFVCILEAHEELEEDLRASRRALQGAREYPVLDWHEDLTEGQEVLFIAFPNPSVRERDRVSRIVRLLNAPEAGAAACEGKPAARAGAGAGLGDAFKDSFADLVEWSTQQASEDAPEADPAAAARAPPPPPAPPPAPSAAPRLPAPAPADQRAAATPLSLEAALLFGAANAAAPPPRPMQGVVPPLPQHVARAGGGERGARGHGGYPAHGAAPGKQQPQQQPAAAPPRARKPQAAPAKGSGPPPHSPPFKSPFPGPARSPFICPRSPYATYFDD